MCNSMIVKSKIIVLILFLIIQFLFIGCKKDDSEDIEVRMRSLMTETAESIKSPGWIAAICYYDIDHIIAGGKANAETGSSMKVNHPIRIGSITKTFVSTLTLILCDEGTLELSYKLNKYYPDFPKADLICIEHLLNHTSGILTWDEDSLIRNSIYNGTENWTIDKLIEWASDKDLIAEPGTAFHYSNIGYFLLGKIIEKETDRSVADLIIEKICLPLDLRNTFMAQVPHPEVEIIHGYDESGGQVMDITSFPPSDDINFELSWTAGGMFSSFSDLVTWARALATGQLLNNELHLRQLPVLNPPTEALPYWHGYGMGISQTDVWIGHAGAISGFICNMNHYPQKNITVISFFNKFSAFVIEYNESDLVKVGDNYLKLLKMADPQSLSTKS